MTTLGIAGWRIRLRCAPEALAQGVARRYAAFAVDDAGPPDLTLDACAGSPGPAPVSTSRTVLEARLRAEGPDYLLDASGICGRIVPSQRQASLQFNSADPQVDLEYFLRIACALLAYQGGGLLVHGAALMRDGAVSLFIGQSGSGKSTVVALSPEAVALGDDMVILRPTSAGWTAYGTPFWNATTLNRAGQTHAGRLAGIYKLIQDREVYLEPLRSAAAAAELVANCPVVNGDTAALAGLLARCRRLAADVPVQRLHFRKDPDFWDCLARNQDAALPE